MTESIGAIEYMQLIEQFPLVPIRDDDHLDEALKQMDCLKERRKSRELKKAEVEYLAVLCDMVSHYESNRVPVYAMSPLELLDHLMKENDLKQSDIAHLFASRANLSEILKGQRNFSKATANKLGKFFDLSPAVFLW